MSQTFSVKDYKGVQEITLSPTGALVVIAGGNGAGKSSFIDAFVELFDPRGVRLTPKPIREGESEARAEFTDTDLGVRVVRTWRADDAGKLEVFALDGAKYSKPAEVVAGLTGGLIFDPVSFLNLDEKKQRDALLAKVDLPFDLDALAREKAGAEERRRDARREAERLQGALSAMPNPLDAPDEEVSGAAVLGEIQNAQDLERRRADLRKGIDGARAAAESIRRKIAELQADLANWEATEAGRTEELDRLPEPQDIAPLQAKLAAVDQTNAAVRARREYAKVADQYAAAATAQARAQDDLDVIEDRKTQGLAAATFPVDGLSIDETGVLFEGIPFKQVNSAAQRRVAFAIATAGAPKLRLVVVKDGDLLDAASLAAIRDLAEERGYTVLVERDRDESRAIGFTIEGGVLAEGGAA